MVKLTVVLVTKRLEPKIDWALLSLKSQTFKNFEYIIIDGYYDKRKDEIKRLIKNTGVDFPVLYLPDKPSRWKGKRPAIDNARNTALVFAKGEYVVHHDDCCRMPPDWLEKHLHYLEQGYIVAGGSMSYQLTDASGKGIEGIYGLDHRCKQITVPTVTGAGWFFGLNCSYPLNAALDINGFDEKFDGELGGDDLHFGLRLERKGYRMMFDPTNVVECHAATHSYEKMIAPVNIKLKDGKDHFSNEYLMQKFYEEPERVMPFATVINLRNVRELCRNASPEQVYFILEGLIDPDPYDWRDMWLIEDKIKEASWDVFDSAKPAQVSTKPAQVDNVFVTNPHKPHVAGYFALGEQPVNIIKFLVENFRPENVLDVGSGPFASKKIFRSLGIDRVWCIDGDDQLLYRDDLINELSTFSVVDLERSAYTFPHKFDLVFSYECAEHITAVDNYVDTVTSNCERILAMTHALPGQGGYHHVNEKDDDYWIKKITAKGFRYLRNISMQARETGDGYFSKSGLIFQRI